MIACGEVANGREALANLMSKELQEEGAYRTFCLGLSMMYFVCVLTLSSLLCSSQDAAVKFPSNRICNQKYNLLTFVPKVSIKTKLHTPILN